MRNKPGFTLIEILVVISIIALLLSIMMPALGAAKERARATVCLSNLRQIGLSALLYAEDHKDFVPRNGGHWIQLFMPYLGRKANQAKDYREVKIYNCPSYPDKRQTVDYVVNSWDNDTIETNGATRLSTFRRRDAKVYLADNACGWWRPIITNETELVEHASIFDVWHLQHLPNSDEEDQTYGRRVARDRHGKASNATFLDGHSQSVRTEEMTPRMWRPR